MPRHWPRLRAWLARPWVRFALRAGCVLVVLALLLRLLDGAAAVAALRRADAAVILLGLVLVHLQILLSALHWKLTAERLGVGLPLARAVREYYVASHTTRLCGIFAVLV